MYLPGLKCLLFSVKFIKGRKKRKEEIAFYFYSSSPVNFLKMSFFNFSFQTLVFHCVILLFLLQHNCWSVLLRHAYFERNDSGNCVFVSHWPNIADAGIPNLGPGYVHIIEAIIMMMMTMTMTMWISMMMKMKIEKCQTIRYCRRAWEVYPWTSQAYRLWTFEGLCCQLQVPYFRKVTHSR